MQRQRPKRPWVGATYGAATPVLLSLGGGGGGRVLEKSAQHTHGIAERLSVRGVKPLQIRVDGRAAVDTHLPQRVDAFRRDADQHRPRIIGVDGARYQA